MDGIIDFNLEFSLDHNAHTIVFAGSLGYDVTDEHFSVDVLLQQEGIVGVIDYLLLDYE